MAFLDQFVHPHKTAPWLNLALACITFGFQPGMVINAYQADGGMCWKTWGFAVVLSILNGMCFPPFFWLLILPLCVVICNYVLAIMHGYKVMKASQEL